MTPIIFVGERQSPLAAARNWTWADGRLCAKTLTEALDAVGLPRARWTIRNLWRSPGLGPTQEQPDLAQLGGQPGVQLIALGRAVEAALKHAGLSCVYMTHPAARGKIRARAAYHAHVRAVLAQLDGSTSP